MLKRIFDIVFSAAGLVVLLPLLVIVAVLIKTFDSGPVLFRQKRIGRHFAPFDLYKFRTMVNDASRSGLAITARHDPRITRLGRILRRTKIDELPQLLNVLRGDMSLVGPRPEVERYVELFKEDFTEILTVKPGITDYASIQYRNEEAVLAVYDDPETGYVNEVLPEKMQLSKRYVRERSLWVDLVTIFRTLYVILRR